MDIRKVKKLIELLEESNLAEIEVKEGDDAVRISRASTIAPAATSVPAAPAAGPAADAGQIEVSKPPENKGFSVNAPMVGTFYRTPSPDAKAFVEIGDHVNVGDTICLIEAMKMFNQIEAEVAGTIRGFSVESGTPIEYGQELLVIDPD